MEMNGSMDASSYNYCRDPGPFGFRRLDDNPELRNLIKNMIQFDVWKRFDAQQALEYFKTEVLW